ncbi:MAG: 3-isopropylmalate dehydratase small subunit, partial [Mesorhizobium sp.]|nr:3-isopropylmalate dehydratase small subunit [Mesorhizobium sp.]
RPDGQVIHFDLEASRKHRLLNGLDDIGMTLERAPDIASFEEKLATERPWA